MTRACENCGFEFTPRRSDARYCSSSCRGDASRKRQAPPDVRRSHAVYATCGCGQALRVVGRPDGTVGPKACRACGRFVDPQVVLTALLAGLGLHKRSYVLQGAA